MGAPSAEERVAMDKLRDQLKDILATISDDYFKSDSFFIRFLRARENNVDAAEKMIRATLTWRRENGIDTLASEPISPFCDANFPVSIEGRDRVGRPLVTVPMGRWDLKQANTDDERAVEFRRYNIQVCERIMAEIRRADVEQTGHVPITQYTVIYDWEGFSCRPMLSISLDKRMVQITTLVESNYPETLANCIYINCSSFISTVLSIIKPAMSSRTFGRIRHFGVDRAIWVPVVLELVDPTQLTPQFGGVKQT